MVKWPEYYIDFNYLLFMPFFSNCLLDCTWLGVATLCNHFVPPVDVSIGEGPDFFRQLLVPAASFPLPFHIWPVEGSIVECQLCSSNHHLHFPVLIERRIFLSTFRLCLEMNNYIMDRKIMQFLCNSWFLCYIMRYMTKIHQIHVLELFCTSLKFTSTMRMQLWTTYFSLATQYLPL